MADWAGLTHDLLLLIAKRVKVMEDFIAFRSVCTSWRTASPKDNFDILSPQLPLLMLPDDHENNYYRQFYSLSKGKVSRKLYLPDAKGRDCFPTHHMGWLLTQSLNGEEVNLFNPFSATKIHLPNQFALRALQSPDDLIEEPEFYRHIKLATLSANPSFTSDYVLVISYDTDVNYLAYWLPGDINWTLFDMDERHGGVCNMTYYKGQFYLLTWGAEIWVVDVQSRDRRVELHLIYLNNNKDLFRHSIQYYLVGVNDALLFVARFGRNRSNYNSAVDTFKCEVYEVDEMKCKLKRIHNLGDSTIFLGLNGATSIDSTKFTRAIKPNHIYFTDDWDEQNLSLECGGGKDTGVYNLEDGNIEYFYPELPLSFYHKGCPSPHDLLVLIVKRVKVMEDFIACHGVCASCRTASTKDNFDLFSNAP
ncbi:F-box protein SKIP23-like [Solanum tuberosum]|uniref:F-box protein SKIP23-like n=1 Tax=Solanum tuberosum TaxID=4113 RepID=UPI00073A31CE|nr:PREDICTED: F-box protein SKIP23-like [Solanum tuberosum]